MTLRRTTLSSRDVERPLESGDQRSGSECQSAGSKTSIAKMEIVGHTQLGSFPCFHREESYL
jgi:hypothetical protein